MNEIQEAIQAGERALSSLREARNQLSGAKGLGLWDMFGGGTFVSIAKHFKIDKARSAVESARFDLMAFSRELRDCPMDLGIDVGSALSLFDIMDNVFADILVQSRLAEAGSRVDDAIARVEQVLARLRAN